MSTPYRNEQDALQERKTTLEGELQRLREQTSQLDELRARENELARQLALVDGRLAASAPQRARTLLPMLDDVRIASPCHESWDAMVGDDRVRHCLGCQKDVYNLSSMPAADAEQLLQERVGDELCVRFYQRADGTVMTQDCAVGVKKKRRKKLAIAIAGAGALAAVTASRLMSRQTMGSIQPPRTPMTVVDNDTKDIVPPVQPTVQQPQNEPRMVTPAVPREMMMGKRVARPTPPVPKPVDAPKPFQMGLK